MHDTAVNFTTLCYFNFRVILALSCLSFIKPRAMRFGVRSRENVRGKKVHRNRESENTFVERLSSRLVGSNILYVHVNTFISNK
jgi:hypothetical protein